MADGTDISRNQMNTMEGHGRDESRHGLAQSEILLHIAGGNPNHITETHYKKSEKDGKNLYGR